MKKPNVKGEKSAFEALKKFLKKYRLQTEIIVSVLGLVTVAVTILCSFGYFTAVSNDVGYEVMAFASFKAYAKLSLVLSAALLLLSSLSVGGDIINGNGTFGAKLSLIAPVLCSATVILIGLFSAYLFGGGTYSCTANIIFLSIGQALIFRLPYVVRIIMNKLKNAKKKGNDKK